MKWARLSIKFELGTSGPQELRLKVAVCGLRASKGELLILVCPGIEGSAAAQAYMRRWNIETGFEKLKSHGFPIVNFSAIEPFELYRSGILCVLPDSVFMLTRGFVIVLCCFVIVLCGLVIVLCGFVIVLCRCFE